MARAIRPIVQIGAPAVPALCIALQRSERTIRGNVAIVLGKIADKRAVNPLINALTDPYWLVRCNAAEALGIIGDVRAVEPLCKALRHSTLRDSASIALGKIGHPNVLPYRILLSPLMDLPARVAALNTLGSNCWYSTNLGRYPYKHLDACQHCQIMARDTDPEIREAAVKMLRFLSERGTLLRATKRDEPTEREQLLRGAAAKQITESGDELLRGTEAPTSPAPEKSILARLLRWPGR